MVRTKHTRKSPFKKRKTLVSGDSNKIDRLSDLPDEILLYILSFLQTIDVVKTSVLAKRWESLWKAIPCLKFDHCHFWSPLWKNIWRQGKFSDNLIEFICWASLYKDPCDIKRFSLSSFNYCNEYWIDRWLYFLVRERNLQELDLSFCPPDRTSYTLPCFVESSERLRTLKLNLYNNYFGITKSVSLNKLTSLHLGSLRFVNDDSARELFLGCPVVEHVILERCVYDTIKVLDISASNLKTLTIENDEHGDIGDKGLRHTELKIFAPNLVSFKYAGPAALDYNIQDVSSVDHLFIQLVKGLQNQSMNGNLMHKFIKGFYNAKVMMLSAAFLEFLSPVIGEPECFPAPFCNLKSLKLHAAVNKPHLQAIVHLLKYSPNLKSLLIDLKTSDGNDYWQPEDEAVACLTYHLKTVEISNFKGQDNELELIKFLLRNGLVLEKMTIAWSKDLKEPMEIIHKGSTMVTFSKASSAVTIKFLERKS